MDKDELKAALKNICSNVSSSSPLYFLLSGVDLSENNLDKIARNAFNEIDKDRNGTITAEKFANSNWALNL
jgi:hypothetical protein